MKQVHVYIFGFVQGVGYRQFVKRQAKKVGLFGWVRNIPDKRVEAVLQGEKEKIEQLIALCRKGPFLSEVENVEVVWEESTEEYKDFSVVTS